MQVSDSCLVLNPATATRNKGINRDLGSKKTSAMSLPADNTKAVSQRQQVNCENEANNAFRKMNGRLESKYTTTTRQQATPPDTKNIPTRTSKRKIGALNRSGPVLEKDDESEQQGPATTSDEAKKPSLPQHEQIQEEVMPLDVSYCCTPASVKLKNILVSRLMEAASWGRIQVVDLSRRGLGVEDSESISSALLNNPQLAVLKLGYNNLGDTGASIIASACSKDGRHHRSLTVLDLGFNYIGDVGCTSISLNLIAGNHTLRNLFLAGNEIKENGAMAIAGALLHGCSLTRLNLTANKFGIEGTKVLTGAIAEMDKRRQHGLIQQQQQGGGGVKTSAQPAVLEELHFRDISLESDGIAAISAMLLSNTGLRILDLANNEIDDRKLALLSQTLAQNKSMPLRALILSFNKITCVGVECLMNAVWGSKTLKELKLDNNKFQDRGAQLCSVVLGSISLETLDISFNRVSTVGIKALMKSLSENDSVKCISLSGIPMDQNASKAVSYALAYNASLEVLNIDSCSIGYSGQRHIVAGIVSNRNVKLHLVTGFPLGSITKTLGLPQVPEDWGNDRVLGFVRYMWSHWQSQNSPNDDTKIIESRGPAPPANVAAAGKKAFASLSESDEARLQFQQMQALQVEESPIIDPDTAILVRSESGQNLQIPTWGDELQNAEKEEMDNESWTSDSDSLDRSSYTDSTHSSRNFSSQVNKERRNKNLQWLQKHSNALHDVGNLVFNNADLWQLHQHFFSPAYDPSDNYSPDSAIEDSEEQNSENLFQERQNDSATSSPLTSGSSKPAKRPSMGRTVSLQTLKSAVEAAALEKNASRPNKRGSIGQELNDAEPCAKRAKNLKPRIAYYPRIREKLESLGTKPSVQTLSLLRQLKYVESMMLSGKNIYVDSDEENDEEGPSAADVEMILLDLL